MGIVVWLGFLSWYPQGRPSPETAGQAATNMLAGLPIAFEPNRGQAENSTQFIARTPDLAIDFSSAGPRLRWRAHKSESAGSLEIHFPGANRQPKIEGEVPLAGAGNYFIGNDPAGWITDLPTYGRLRYRQIYPGVDLVFYGRGRHLEYDFVIAPGADPAKVRMEFAGADRMWRDDSGNLILVIEDRELAIRAPAIYQETERGRQAIPGHYVINEDRQVSLELADFDAARPLIVDPIIDFSTYLGGVGLDTGYAVTVDPAGNIYVVGQTASLNFPTRNPLFNALNGANDAFIVKVNPQGSTVLFSTYLGGRNPGDRAWAVAVDRNGHIHVCGETNSVNFPIVNGAQTNFRGNTDAFISILANAGNALLYSSYLGGSFQDVAYGMALDDDGNIYLTGGTKSSNFPTRNPLQAELRGPKDAFVAKLNAAGELVFSTYLGGDAAGDGGSEDESGFGIALDPWRNIYLAGLTSSPTFPTVNALQAHFGGVEDAFIARIEADGSKFAYATYLGGSRADNARGIAVDAFGQVYLTGYTFFPDFPTVDPLQPDYKGNIDAFVAKLSAAGDRLIFSTFLGGSAEENTGILTDLTPSSAIAVDKTGNIYVAGKTGSTDFPTVFPIQGTLRGHTDAFVAKIDPAGSALLFSTFLGSSFIGDNGIDERALGLAIDPFGGMYLTGQVLQNDLPTVLPFQPNYGGGLSDAFLIKVSTPDLTTVAPVSAANYIGSAIAPESIVAVFGSNLAPTTEVAAAVPLPLELQSTSVTVEDRLGAKRPAPLFFVSPFQINLQIPPGTAPGRATLTVGNAMTLPGGKVSATIWINPVAPSLFAANADGQGVPAAQLLRIKADGTVNYEPVARLNFQGRYEPIPLDLGPESDQLYLVLFGTGWRNVADLSRVTARIGGIDVPVLYAGAQADYVGLDQINVPLPRQLMGRGEVSLALSAESMLANLLTVNVR